MTDRAVITFASLKFERNDFLVFALLYDFRGYLSAGNEGITMRELVTVSIHQHIAEGRLLARFGVQQIDIDRVAFRDPILPSTGLNNCVSHKISGEKKPRKIPQLCWFYKWKAFGRSEVGTIDLNGLHACPGD